jgi:hypothetical protein
MTRQEAAKLLNCSFQNLLKSWELQRLQLLNGVMTKKFLFLREIQVKELAAGRNPLFKSKAKRNISQSKK